MANAYIVIRNSVEQAAFVADPNTWQGKKFRVVHAQGFRPGLRKTDSMSETVGGKIDHAIGSVFYEWQGVIRTEETLNITDQTANYGDLSDLETYYKLNDPAPAGGSPSNIITLVDHYGTAHEGILAGEHLPEPLTVTLSGEHAHYLIPIRFVQLQAVQ